MNSTFESERSKLVGEVAQAMERAVNNMNELNRNIENLVEVGHDFTKVQEVWGAFAEGVRGEEKTSASSGAGVPRTA